MLPEKGESNMAGKRVRTSNFIGFVNQTFGKVDGYPPPVKVDLHDKFLDRRNEDLPERAPDHIDIMGRGGKKIVQRTQLAPGSSPPPSRPSSSNQ